MIAVEHLRSGKKVTLHVPMFHGYAFALFDRVADDWQPMQSCDGVKRVISASYNQPLPLPVGFVEGLIDSAGDRLHLPVIRGKPMLRHQTVLVEEGPFSGYLGSVSDCDGLNTLVMVTIFGRSVEVMMRRSAVSVR